MAGKHSKTFSDRLPLPGVRRAVKSNPIARFFFDTIRILVAALALSILVKTFLIQSFYVPSGSMLNTLHINDRIIVNKLQPELLPVTRGDIVVFKDPGEWLPKAPATNETPIDQFLIFAGLEPDPDSQHLVKRIIGMPGDHIISKGDGTPITINGQTIDETSYLAPGANPSNIPFDITVPANHIWVMGDNRDNSADSRYHMGSESQGFVNMNLIVGKAVATVWPVPNWSGLDNHSNVYANVPAPTTTK